MEKEYYSSTMAEPNKLELKDDLKSNVSMKINGADIHRIHKYEIIREPLSYITLKLEIPIDEKISSIEINN